MWQKTNLNADLSDKCWDNMPSYNFMMNEANCWNTLDKRWERKALQWKQCSRFITWTFCPDQWKICVCFSCTLSSWDECLKGHSLAMSSRWLKTTLSFIPGEVNSTQMLLKERGRWHMLKKKNWSFFLTVLGHLCYMGFSLVAGSWVYSSFDTWASHCGGFPWWGKEGL